MSRWRDGKKEWWSDFLGDVWLGEMPEEGSGCPLGVCKIGKHCLEWSGSFTLLNNSMKENSNCYHWTGRPRTVPKNWDFCDLKFYTLPGCKIHFHLFQEKEWLNGLATAVRLMRWTGDKQCYSSVLFSKCSVHSQFCRGARVSFAEACPSVHRPAQPEWLLSELVRI